MVKVQKFKVRVQGWVGLGRVGSGPERRLKFSKFRLRNKPYR